MALHLPLRNVHSQLISSLLLMDAIQKEILKEDVFQLLLIPSILLMIRLLELIMYRFQ